MYLQQVCCASQISRYYPTPIIYGTGRENDNAWRTSNLEVNIWLRRKKFHLPHPLIVAGLYQNTLYHMHTFSNLNEDTPEVFIGFSFI